jgi:outer membrane receptor protein involved in Fe transport
MGIRNISGYRVYNDEYWVTETLRVIYPSTVTRQFLYFKHHRRPLTNQVEFSGPVKLLVNHDFLMGWDHQFYRTRTTRVDSASVLTTPIDMYNPVETHVTRTEFPPTRQDYTTNFTNGLYVQDHMTLSSKLKAVVGLRLDKVRRYTHNNPVANGVETEVAEVRRDSHKPTERVGLVYQPVNNVDVYGQFATAFQPNFNLQPDGTPLEPTYGVSYEVGQRLRRHGRTRSSSTRRCSRSPNATSRSAGRAVSSSRWARFVREASRPTSTRACHRRSISCSGYGYTDATYLDYRSTRRPTSPATTRRACRPTRCRRRRPTRGTIRSR